MGGYDDRPVAGVGGWLAFFLVALGLFTPLGTLVLAYQSLYGDPTVAVFFGDRWGALQAAQWLLVAVVICGCWYVVWRLYTIETWSSVRIAVAWLWIMLVGGGVLDLAMVWLIAGVDLQLLLSGVAPQDYIRPVVFSVVWTLYLLNSKRVANTYRGDPEETAEVFA